MNHFLIILSSLMFSLSIISCNKNVKEDNNSNNMVKFTINKESLSTRGTPIISAKDIPDMGVFAYYTGNGTENNWAANGKTAMPNFMNNVFIANINGSWNYMDHVYWPQAEDANVTFFAYSPFSMDHKGVTIINNQGIPTLSYTIPEICANQPDLMVSALEQNLNKTTNNSSPVTFKMKHALTCVGFSATGHGESISKIIISGVKTTGELTVSEDGTSTWNVTNFPETELKATPNRTIVLDNISQSIITDNGYLMMIPQQLSNEAKLEITLSNDSKHSFALTGTWIAGQQINYTIDIP